MSRNLKPIFCMIADFLFTQVEYKGLTRNNNELHDHIDQSDTALVLTWLICMKDDRDRRLGPALRWRAGQ